ncbi:MAG TPA: FAD-binding oxidoreductase, partial [bacterium]|nr:FAD-binding oxidoreductase [bacterium]
AAVKRQPELLASRAIDGVYPCVICSPANAEEVSAALRVCSETDAAVTPWGGGTAVKIGNIPERVEVIIDVSKLNHVIEHDYANLTATVQSGITLAAMEQVTAGARQFVPFDVPSPQRSTLGGIASANLNGARRGCYGSVRDLVIGMKLALPTGEHIKAGGKVVKNVAGYDMCKLFIGSLGTLGIITEVTFKMAPVPERAATIAVNGHPADAFRLVNELFASTLQPSAIALINQWAAQTAHLDGPAGGLAVAVEGFREAVDRHIRDVSAMAGRMGLSARVLEGTAHDALWTAVRDFPSLSNGHALFRLTVPLGSVGAAADALSRGKAGASTESGAWIAHAGSGTLWLRVPASAVRETFAKLIALASEHRGHAVLAASHPSIKRDLDVWGPPPPSLSIMREIKQRFDPQHLFNPGRFVAFL